MTSTEAIPLLHDLIRSREEITKKVWKSKWRDSEKVMTAAKYGQQIEALKLAIATIGGENVVQA